MEDADIERWARMRSRLWPHEDPSELRSELSGLLEPSHSYFGWMIERSEEPVGFAEVSIKSFVDGCELGPAAYLEAIWVEPKHRRTGVAQRALQVVEQWAVDRGLRELGSDCSLDNEVSQLWHLAAGFKEIGRAINYHKAL